MSVASIVTILAALGAVAAAIVAVRARRLTARAAAETESALAEIRRIRGVPDPDRDPHDPVPESKLLDLFPEADPERGDRR